MKFISTLALLLMISTYSFGQETKITGSVADASTKEPVSSASITVRTKKSAAAGHNLLWIIHSAYRLHE